MPTPSEGNLWGAWSAHTDTPKRSVFGNYRADVRKPVADATDLRSLPSDTNEPITLQTGVDLAVARSFIHRFLAKAYEEPTPEGWQWLSSPATQADLRAAWAIAGNGKPVSVAFSCSAFASFLDVYLAVFGHAARGSCPLNEIEYGDIKADPLFQPHRLADLAGFYGAFGLQVAADAGERQDHLCFELEFMCVLAAKEAYALEYQLAAGLLDQCREAQRKFLREHLGRWTPAFARRLAGATSDATMRMLAEFARSFIECECARFGVKPGSDELALRPVDEAADRMCGSCGLTGVTPGSEPAMTTP